MVCVGMLFSTVLMLDPLVQSLPWNKQSTNSFQDHLRDLESQFEAVQHQLNETERNLWHLKQLINSQEADAHTENFSPTFVTLNEPSTTTANPIIDISLGGTEIGFSAKLSNQLNDMPTFSVIKYDYIIFNAGNGYDAKTGIFTVPVEGMYMFSYFVESLGAQAAEIQLIVDGMIRFPAISDPSSPGNDDTGSNMVIEHLVKGQQVWIETYETENQNIYPGFTTFSGALIN